MNLQSFAPPEQHLIHVIDGENAAAPVQIGEIARLYPLPTSSADALGEHCVEHQAARSG
jgi:hypothetical protein